VPHGKSPFLPVSLEDQLMPGNQAPQDPALIYNNNIGENINNNKLDNNLLLLGSDIIIINNEIYSIEYKTDFTEKEKRFLEIYLSGNISMDMAI